jgi:hypothetical protein
MELRIAAIDRVGIGDGRTVSPFCNEAVAADTNRSLKEDDVKKQYVRPEMKCLGLLRLVTRFSF